MRIYDPRIGKFLSVDPLFESYPYYTPYQFAGNNPIKYIDLDGLERVDPTVEAFYKTTPQLDMTDAPGGSKMNAAGFPRNSRWFWSQMLQKHPEMFSPKNKGEIKGGRAPLVDDKWIEFNSSHADYKGNKLIHHHIEQGKIAAGIPEQVHLDYFKELHPDLKPKGRMLKGSKLKGIGGAMSIIGAMTDLAGFFNGNPDSWYNMFPCIGCSFSGSIGKVIKEQKSGLYYTITDVEKTYDDKQRVRSEKVSYDIYRDYIWDEDAGKYKGIDKVGTREETFYYDEKGKRSQGVDWNQGA